jgi:hypothetical protein
MVAVKRSLLVVLPVLLTGVLGVANAAAAPAIDKVHTGRGTSKSTNWSGYAAYNSTFNHAKGDWTVPAVNCSSVKGQQVAITTAFVGIDGYDSNTVEQTGTDSDCVGRNASYVAWYEFYPDRAIFLNSSTNPVSPGDHMHAEVSVSGSTATVSLQNVTRNWTMTPQSLSSPNFAFSSAEWIVESPASKLAPFSQIDFSNAGAANGGSDQPINYSGWSNDAITMVSKNGRTTRTHPVPSSNASTSFSVVFDSP